MVMGDILRLAISPWAMLRLPFAVSIFLITPSDKDWLPPFAASTACAEWSCAMADCRPDARANTIAVRKTIWFIQISPVTKNQQSTPAPRFTPSATRNTHPESPT
jgi:hypothetical protein